MIVTPKLKTDLQTNWPNNLTVDLRKWPFHNQIKHCVKSVCTQSYSSPYFPAVGLNTDRIK